MKVANPNMIVPNLRQKNGFSGSLISGTAVNAGGSRGCTLSINTAHRSHSKNDGWLDITRPDGRRKQRRSIEQQLARNKSDE